MNFSKQKLWNSYTYLMWFLFLIVWWGNVWFYTIAIVMLWRSFHFIQSYLSHLCLGHFKIHWFKICSANFFLGSWSHLSVYKKLGWLCEANVPTHQKISKIAESENFWDRFFEIAKHLKVHFDCQCNWLAIIGQLLYLILRWLNSDC